MPSKRGHAAAARAARRSRGGGLAAAVLLGTLSFVHPAMAIPPPPTLPPVDTSVNTTLDSTVVETEDAKDQLHPPQTATTAEPSLPATRSEGAADRGDAEIGVARQPAGNRPRISVRKSNDANADGSFSDREDAPRPEADVRFRVQITNEGDQSVEIAEISDSYRLTTIDVCADLIGDRIAPGSTVECTFKLDRYAPPRFDSVANTVSVVVRAVSDSGRRASSEDVSTVITPGDGSGDPADGSETQVLGEQVTRGEAGQDPPSENPPAPAVTGLSVLPLASAALFLALAGALFLGLGRRLERRVAGGAL